MVKSATWLKWGMGQDVGHSWVHHAMLAAAVGSKTDRGTSVNCCKGPAYGHVTKDVLMSWANAVVSWSQVWRN
jgi:hypothetical protein